MTHKDVVKFIDKAVGDAALQAKLKDIKATNDEEAMEQLIQIASDSGCSFKESEFDDLCLALAATRVKNETGKELSQEKLKSLANDASVFRATREMQEMIQQFNMHYLMLQQKIQSLTREFNLISNVMRTKHEAAKNAVNNVR